MLSSPILFDVTKLFAFPWRLDCVGPLQMRCQLSRYKVTEEIEQEFSLEANLTLIVCVSCYSCCFQTLVSHGYFRKIIITISGLDEISDSFKKRSFVYNCRDNRFKEFPAPQICPYWGFLKSDNF